MDDWRRAIDANIDASGEMLRGSPPPPCASRAEPRGIRDDSLPGPDPGRSGYPVPVDPVGSRDRGGASGRTGLAGGAWGRYRRPANPGRQDSTLSLHAARSDARVRARRPRNDGAGGGAGTWKCRAVLPWPTPWRRSSSRPRRSAMERAKWSRRGPSRESAPWSRCMSIRSVRWAGLPGGGGP